MVKQPGSASGKGRRTAGPGSRAQARTGSRKGRPAANDGASRGASRHKQSGAGREGRSGGDRERDYPRSRAATAGGPGTGAKPRRSQPTAQPERRGGPRLASMGGRRPEPAISDGVTGGELDRSVHAQLRTLSKENAEGVAQHLVMAAALLDEDPVAARAHAETAVRRAGRVPAAREALGLVAYRQGDFARALAEFRTARRLSGSSHLLALLVDCERALGRPGRALEIAASPRGPHPRGPSSGSSWRSWCPASAETRDSSRPPRLAWRFPSCVRRPAARGRHGCAMRMPRPSWLLGTVIWRGTGSRMRSKPTLT